MASHSGTEKIVSYRTISVTDDVATSEAFEPKRGCRVLNGTANPVTVTVYEVDPFSKECFQCEDINPVTIAAQASKDLGPQVFASWRLVLKVASGATELVVVSAE